MGVQEKATSQLEVLTQTKTQFLEDLEAVFEGRHLEFGEHLQAMLFELWTRARGASADVVTELKKLRELRRERFLVREFVQEAVFETTQELVRVEEVGDLMDALIRHGSVLDKSLVVALERVITTPDGKAHGQVDGDLYVLSPPEASFRGAEPKGLAKEIADLHDELRTLRDDLTWRGVLPTDPQNTWEWHPVFLNTKTGERRAFGEGWHTSWPAGDQQRIRVRLASDGTQWWFPNPRPRGHQGDPDSFDMTVWINGSKCEDHELWKWNWTWHPLDDVHVATSVTGLPIEWPEDTMVVEAEYPLPPEKI